MIIDNDYHCLLNYKDMRIHALVFPTHTRLILVSTHPLQYGRLPSCNQLSATSAVPMMPQGKHVASLRKLNSILSKLDPHTCWTAFSRSLWSTAITNIVKWVIWCKFSCYSTCRLWVMHTFEVPTQGNTLLQKRPYFEPPSLPHVVRAMYWKTKSWYFNIFGKFGVGNFHQVSWQTLW